MSNPRAIFGLLLLSAAVLASLASLLVVTAGASSGSDSSGCTPGYWKNNSPAWEKTGYLRTDSFESIFGRDALTGNPTLLDVLELRGGGLRALSRHAVAALLNAAHPAIAPAESIDTPTEVIARWQAAFDDRSQVAAVHALFESSNASGCPIDAHGNTPARPSSTATLTPGQTPSVTPGVSATSTPTRTPPATPTPSATTDTATSTATSTPAATHRATATSTVTGTPTLPATSTGTPTTSAAATSTVTGTPVLPDGSTSTPAPSATASPTSTSTTTLAATPTATATQTPSITPSATMTGTITPTPSPTSSATPLAATSTEVMMATPTATPSRTATVTASSTPTPGGPPSIEKAPVRQNLFLTRQGDKLAPARCLDSSDTATFAERLNVPLTSPDPSDPAQSQKLGAFEIWVAYDPSSVCLELRPGPAAAGMLCLIEDGTNSLLEGIARIGCVTQGKDVFPDTTTPAGRHLADVIVRPQPALYSAIRADQENGVVVSLLDFNCELSDLQGVQIFLASCDDAAATVRYLEGDVVPDCVVDVLDTQAVAFAYGSTEGTARYNERFDVEPASGDGDIDILDLQFVAGRLTSTCDAPHPPQDPR